MKRVAAGLAVVVLAGLTAPVAAATPDNCVEQFWRYGLRAATRIICDSPITADGSWTRGRAFTAPGYVADGISVCYSAVFCTYTPAREVAALDVRDYYRVTPQTVLPDEPGHVGGSPAVVA